jgi:PAS domain S-box-containing protein
MRKTGISVLGDVPWGTHFCQFYQSREDLIDILVPYLQAGLENNEFCMWVTSTPLKFEEAKAALKSAVPDLDSRIDRGQIEILDYSQWYTVTGRFEADRVLRGWVEKEEEALRLGYDGLRLTGNTFWLEKPDWRTFAEYEAAVNEVLPRRRMLALCTYSLERCGAFEVVDVVSHHKFALIKRDGRWEIIESSTQRMVEQALRESERRYQSLFETMSEGFALHEIVCDKEGKPCDYRFLEVNPAFERLTGLKRQDVVGKTLSEVLPNSEPFWVQSYGRVALTGEPAHFEQHTSTLRRHYEVFAYRTAPGQFACLFLDITERKRAQEALAESNTLLERRVRERTRELEEAGETLRREIAGRLRSQEEVQRLAAIVESSDDAIIGATLDGSVATWNHGAEHIYGYCADEMIGKPGAILMPPDRPNEVPRILARIKEGERVDQYETVRVRKDGQFITVSLTVSPIKDASGRVVGASIIARDTTQRRRMEEELRAASSYARSLIEASLDPLVTISPDGKITDVNRATELATGRSRTSLIGSDFSDYFTEPEKAREGYQTVIAKGFVRDYPLTVRHAAGRTTDVLYNATVYRNEEGGIQGVFAAARDITDRKRAETSLAESEARYRSLVTATTQIVWTTNAQGEVTGDLPLWQAFTGQTEQETQGWGWTAALHPEDRDRTAGVWTRSVQTRTLYDIEYRLRRHDGVYRTVAVRGVPVLASDGTIREWIGTCTDITERREAEKELDRHRRHLEELVAQRTGELEAANRQLQTEIGERQRAVEESGRAAQELARSNRDLEQFAYVASHDLQEPLRAVAGYIGLLQRRYGESLDASAGEYIAGALDGATRMQGLIGDLLVYSRAGTRGKEPGPAEVQAILKNTMENLRASIQESGAVITADPLPTVQADAVQLTQLFQNLIGNAIKFRADRPPQIHIGARREKSRWIFSVRDNGVGIDPQYHERIFLIFQRLHTRTKYPGTGIGLAICKKIVERHGGEIWLESQPGQGSTFYFTIPDKGEQ